MPALGFVLINCCVVPSVFCVLETSVSCKGSLGAEGAGGLEDELYCSSAAFIVCCMYMYVMLKLLSANEYELLIELCL